MPETLESNGIHKVQVNLAERSYVVMAGDNLLDQSGDLIRETGVEGRRAAVVTDSNVAALYGEQVQDSLRAAGFEPTLITVPAGESSKSMEMVASVCRQMLQHGMGRKSLAVALGGGVVGDLAGFCAAILNRGVPFVQIPTTVLSQVDSSVGGKTGVNAPEGKNLLGAFHQPRLVIADTGTLRSLPDRVYQEGFAEVIKHAAIRDADMLLRIEEQGMSREGLAPLIAENVFVKAAIVEEDEQETKGVRALLNFGHTIGHAVEGAAGYEKMLHGEAISIGMMAALRLSILRAGLKEDDAARIERLLDLFNLPKSVDSGFTVDQIMDLLRRDKKFADGQVRFVLLDKPGFAFLSSDVTEEDIRVEVERLIAG